MTAPPTTVFVHGAWHGAWCWEAVTPVLDREGRPWKAIDLPLTGLADDIAAVKSMVASIPGDTVLVGHSYGGSVITGAGAEPDVVGLVFVSAMALKPGESSTDHEFNDLVAWANEQQLKEYLFDEFGNVAVNPERGTEFFYHDLDPDVAVAAVARLRPMALACLTDKVDVAGWQGKPAVYVLTTDDRAVPPAIQERLAERINARTVRLATSHSPFYVAPEAVAGAIVAIDDLI